MEKEWPKVRKRPFSNQGLYQPKQRGWGLGLFWFDAKELVENYHAGKIFGKIN